MRDTSQLSNPAGGLDPTAFHQQLRRLESLQTLMQQGSRVVGDVTQFLILVREELTALARRHESLAGAQEQWLEEKSLLSTRLAESDRLAAEAQLRAAEQERMVAHLSSQVVGRDVIALAEHEQALAEERERHQRSVQALQANTARLEQALGQERALLEGASAAAKAEASALAATEMSQLRERVMVLERQLAAELSRRARLMEVVKAHQVTLVPASPTSAVAALPS